MKQPSETVVFFGNERLATGVTTTAPLLRGLIESGYHVAAVVVNHHDSGGRTDRPLEVVEVAKQHGIPVLMPDKLADSSSQFEELDAAVGILAAYGKIVPQSIIDLFPRGIINLHPSLLPKHRGPTPLESVIVDGSDLTGVSIMQLAKEMDAGPIFAQSEYKLDGAETKQQLADRLLEIGSTMLLDILPDILAGSIVALPQDESAATYDALITKAAAELDFHKSAQRLEREIRAYEQWPKSHTIIGGIDVVVTAARAASLPSQKTPGEFEVLHNPDMLLVYCSDGYLSLERLKPAGKKEMSVSEFIRGYSSRL